METPRLKQGIFGLDVFLSNFLRHECDSQHKRPKAKFLSFEVNPTSLTSVGKVVPGDLFCPTFRAATMARYFMVYSDILELSERCTGDGCHLEDKMQKLEKGDASP